MQERSHVNFPKISWVFYNFERLLAFGFGSGLIRLMPGTCGTLFAWFIWFLVISLIPTTWISILLIFSFIYGCKICQDVSNALQTVDHIGIVWDEMVSFWIVLHLIQDNFIFHIIGFFLFRLFDSVKPQPIKFFDKNIKTGFGIMLDDLLAALYSIMIIHFINYLYKLVSNL